MLGWAFQMGTNSKGFTGLQASESFLQIEALDVEAKFSEIESAE